ncbi:ATP-binding cassette sub-family D member 4, partial [Stegodyphus mimosarum]
MKPIVTKVVQQEKCEGNFRFKHMHVRTNAESIAFQDANIAELSRSDNKLVALIKIQQSLYLRQFPLNVAVKVFSYFGSIISYLILAYPIFSGTYDDLTPPELSALISKNAFVSIYLISCFSSLIDLSSQISEIGGLTHRVFEILDILNLNYEEDISDCSSKSSKFKMKSGEFYQEAGDSQVPVIELNNVTFCAPRETKPLISDISLEIFIGKNLLITGKSSSGKTSLFRIIKGLWPIDEGTITRRLPFQPSSVFFLPQRSLLSDGTLLEQIVYPLELPRFLKPHHEDIDLILGYLHFAELDHVLKKAGLDDDVDWNWYDVLSPGEAQRLSFVRLFYHRPKLAFLDEATSALGLDLETKLYKKCTELGITLVSIGHRTSLVQFHNDILHLDGEGGWTLTPVDEIN